MKKPNSFSEFNDQRRRHLLAKYRESIARQSRIVAETAFRDAADSPAPRFWVSEERATEVISKLLSNPALADKMYEEKKKMYLEIYRRVKKLMAVYPNAPLNAIVFKVVNSEAPHSYMTWQRAAQIIR